MERGNPSGANDRRPRQPRTAPSKLAAGRRVTSRMETYRHQPRSNLKKWKARTLAGTKTQNAASKWGRYCAGTVKSNGKLNGSRHPARVVGKVAGDPINVRSWHGG